MRVLLLLVVTFCGLAIISAFAGISIYIAVNKVGPPPAAQRAPAKAKPAVELTDWQREMRITQQKNNAAVRSARRWSDSRLARQVRAWVLDGTGWDDEDIFPPQVFEALGPRVHEPVLALLADQGLYQKLVQKQRRHTWDEYPLERACDLLGETPPSEALELLVPFQSDHQTEIRSEAAAAIAKVGTVSILPYVRRSLADSDEQVARNAIFGLHVAMEQKRLVPRAQEMLIPDLKQLLVQGKPIGRVAELLTLLDPDGSPQFLLSSEVLRADSAAIDEVLREILQEKIAIPHDQLLALIAEFEAMTLEYPTDYALGNALRIVGRQKHPEAEALLRQRLSHENGGVYFGAADGLINLADLEDFEDRIWVYEENAPKVVLTEQQKLYQLLWDSESEIGDGGLYYYFGTSSADQWREVLAAYEMLGLQEHHAIMSEAAALFGSEGPATDLETRTKQIESLFSEEGTEFQALDTRYFETEENLKVPLTNYVLENADAFR